jgi:cysteine-rich repeat protein
MAPTILDLRLRATRIAVSTLSCLLLACASGEVNNEGSFAETSSEPTGDGDGDGDMSEGPTTGTDLPGDGDGDEPSCTEVGCACDYSPDSCAPGIACVAAVCTTPVCGNGIAEHPIEQCDDGNDFEGDGCDNDCTFTTVDAIAAGSFHTCALIEGGRVRCWGLNHVGQLGYGNTNNIGDNEFPAQAGDVVLGESAEHISVGSHHACAQLSDQTLRCWGYNGHGQLGQGNLDNVGDDEFPFSVSPVPINVDVLEVVAGGSHTCARVGAGNVRCWGRASEGQLGYGNTTQLAVPLTIDLNLGNTSSLMSAGEYHNCAVLDDGNVRCWGLNDSGQLGYGNTENIGDNEVPGNVTPVPIMPQGIAAGTPVVDIALASAHSCAIFEGGDLLCWGANFYGQLGQGSTTTVGDNETLATLFPIDLGGDAIEVVLGRHHTCALLDDNTVKCWGRNLYGQLGRGDLEHIGDDELPAEIETIELGGEVTALTAGDHHTCVVVDAHEVVCWGFNDYGQLGYGDTERRGDDELPIELGPVPLF